MEKEIWKYEISADQTIIEMPKDAEILSVQVQHEVPRIWALVDPENPIEERVIEIFGTGHKIPCEGISRKFIGTFQLYGGSLVFHLFERTVDQSTVRPVGELGVEEVEKDLEIKDRAPRSHYIKTYNLLYSEILNGERNSFTPEESRDFRSGDTIYFQEWGNQHGRYTGRVTSREIISIDENKLIKFIDTVELT